MFFQKRIHDEQKGQYEVNMTPLIDVSLVLVVMLLLATPLAFESSIGVRNSAATAKAAKTKSDDTRIELTVVTDDSVRVNRVMVAREGLSAALEPLLQNSQSDLVIVQCAKHVSHGAFVDVLDQAKLCGAADIAVAGR